MRHGIGDKTGVLHTGALVPRDGMLTALVNSLETTAAHECQQRPSDAVLHRTATAACWHPRPCSTAAVDAFTALLSQPSVQTGVQHEFPTNIKEGQLTATLL